MSEEKQIYREFFFKDKKVDTDSLVDLIQDAVEVHATIEVRVVVLPSVRETE